MSESTAILSARLKSTLKDQVTECVEACGEVTITINADSLIDVCTTLRDDPSLCFEQLIDLCGVDYSTYANQEWPGQRYAVVYHLLSMKHNQRLRVKVFLNEDFPQLSSIVSVWACANWFEREAFDLFGIVFDGHPDLRRLLTDYGFIGHPFRKDFPLIGQVETRYDEDKKRVVYQPVSIEARVEVPRIIRHDNRYIIDSEANNG